MTKSKTQKPNADYLEDSTDKKIESNNSAQNIRNVLPSVWYIGLLVLATISFLGLITVCLLVLIVPSDIQLEIKKAGMTVTIIGGVGLFLVLLKMYFNAYARIVKLLLTILGVWVIAVSSVTLYDLSKVRKYEFETLESLRYELGSTSRRLMVESNSLSRELETLDSLEYRIAKKPRYLKRWYDEEESAKLALQIIGKRGTEPLIEALHSDDLDIRIGAIWALGQIGDPIALEPLIRLLMDSNHTVREKAATSLGKLKNPLAVEALIMALDDPNPDVRENAIWAIVEIKGPKTIQHLISTFKSSNNIVRKAAIEALGRIGDPIASQHLISELRDNDITVKKIAIQALGRMSDKNAVHPLVELLKDEDSNIREIAAQALGSIGDPEAIKPLIFALKDEDAHVKQAAIKALEAIGIEYIPMIFEEKSNNTKMNQPHNKANSADAKSRAAD